MSYISDPLYRKCNLQMVELLQLQDKQDLDFVKEQLEKFVEATDSQVAKNLLSDWPAKTNRFVKVFIK